MNLPSTVMTAAGMTIAIGPDRVPPLHRESAPNSAPSAVARAFARVSALYDTSRRTLAAGTEILAAPHVCDGKQAKSVPLGGRPADQLPATVQVAPSATPVQTFVAPGAGQGVIGVMSDPVSAEGPAPMAFDA